MVKNIATAVGAGALAAATLAVFPSPATANAADTATHQSPTLSSTVSRHLETRSGRGATLTISGMHFSRLRVKAGRTVTVKNLDPFTHTVTAVKAGLHVVVPSNGRATFRAPAMPGTYRLTCDIHASMHGKMIVT
ncbi:MAG: cupredoxin domain-containing protein [Actinomycetes bacterium]